MALLSPQLYRDYILPVDQQIAAQFPCVAFHLHGSALWAIDELVQVQELDVLELNQEDARCDVAGTFAGGHKMGQWLSNLGVKTLYIEPGSPWENGYLESFNGKLRDEFLNVETFDTLLEAQVLVERWPREYNTVRPHSALNYRPPARSSPGISGTSRQQN